MIARLWQGEVPLDRADAYIALMQEIAIPDYSRIPGNLGAWCLHRIDEDFARITMLTFWKDEAAIRSFAGEDATKAKYYPFDYDYLIHMNARVEHHQIAG